MKKKSASAGTFYPSDKEELTNLIRCFEIKQPPYSSRAVIIPHAGYIYSGKLAANGIQHLKKDAKNVFIFAPAHYERIFGCTVCDYDTFETPLGDIKVNKKLIRQAAEFCDCNKSNFAFEKEHSIEVQLPLIKYFMPEAEVVPVLYGCENFKNLCETLEYFWADENNVFVISSDLSHFYPEKEAVKIDNYTARMIEENNFSNFEQEQACGAVGICGLIEFTKKKNFSLIRTGLTNSSAATGDSSRVVGYGSWFLYEGEKNNYIKEYYFIRNKLILVKKRGKNPWKTFFFLKKFLRFPFRILRRFLKGVFFNKEYIEYTKYECKAYWDFINNKEGIIDERKQ